MTPAPLIFDIRRGAMDDGPGIRTTVFFKGCPLSCTWCHNPESIRTEPELLFDVQLCVGCAACCTVCPTGAAQWSLATARYRERCAACGTCAAVCPPEARRLAGRGYQVDELVNYLLQDADFYRATGGGVTFSGGEPTLYGEFLSEILRGVKRAEIGTAIQTCGLFELEVFRRCLLPYLDLVYFDLKLFDCGMHEEFTGLGNERILGNFSSLFGEIGGRVIPRVPLVPGVTATDSNLMEIAGFLGKLGITKYELLPYNPAGIGKRRRLGYPVSRGLTESFMEPEEVSRLGELFRRQLGVPQN